MATILGYEERNEKENSGPPQINKEAWPCDQTHLYLKLGAVTYNEMI
jgi:hypothetical protein